MRSRNDIIRENIPPLAPPGSSMAEEERARARRKAWMWEDPMRAVEACVPVENKYDGGRITDWTILPGQAALEELWQKIEKWNRKRNAGNSSIPDSVKHGPVKIVCLKGRSEGISSYVQGRSLIKCHTHEAIAVGVMAHLDDVSKNVLRKARLYNDQWRGPLDLRVPLPPGRRGADDEIEFSNYSRMVAMTAGSDSASRSYTFHVIHGSEVAHFKSMTGWNAMLQTAPDWADIIVESTANGEGGYYYETWQKAMYFDDVVGMFERNDVAAMSRWNGFFRMWFAWYMNPANSRPFTSWKERQHLQHSLDEDEQRYVRELKLTLEQLNWRRWTIKTKCQNEPGMTPVQYFKQEYPTFPEEAFVGRGTRYFDAVTLGQQQTEMLNQGFLARILLLPGVAPIPADDGGWNLTIVEPPKAGHRYIIGCDPAQGAGDDGDHAVSRVWDVTFARRRCVAEWRSQSMEVWEHADATCVLGELYNWALLNFDHQGQGQAFAMRILQNMYQPVFLSDKPAIPGKGNLSALSSYGVNMNTTHRNAALGALQRGIRDNTVFIGTERALHEYRAFKVINKKPQGPPGDWDDVVFADATAIYADEQTPRPALDEIPVGTPEYEQGFAGQCWDAIRSKVEKSERRNRKLMAPGTWHPRPGRLPPTRFRG